MSLITVVGLNVVFDVAILSALVYVCRLPRHLEKHQQPTPAGVDRRDRTPELGYEQRAA